MGYGHYGHESIRYWIKDTAVILVEEKMGHVAKASQEK